NIVKPMAFEDCAGLLSLSNDPTWQQAVINLYLGTTPAQIGLPAISIPSMYAAQLSWNAAKSELTLAGVITDADKAALLSLGKSYPWQQAIEALFATIPNAANPFAGINEEMSTATDAAQLYGWFLSAISPVYQPLMQSEMLASKVASNFGVSNAVAT